MFRSEMHSVPRTVVNLCSLGLKRGVHTVARVDQQPNRDKELFPSGVSGSDRPDLEHLADVPPDHEVAVGSRVAERLPSASLLEREAVDAVVALGAVRAPSDLPRRIGHWKEVPVRLVGERDGVVQSDRVSDALRGRGDDLVHQRLVLLVSSRRRRAADPSWVWVGTLAQETRCCMLARARTFLLAREVKTLLRRSAWAAGRPPPLVGDTRPPAGSSRWVPVRSTVASPRTGVPGPPRPAWRRLVTGLAPPTVSCAKPTTHGRTTGGPPGSGVGTPDPVLGLGPPGSVGPRLGFHSDRAGPRDLVWSGAQVW